MFSNNFIFGFSNRKSLFLSFISERNKVLLSLKKTEKALFKILLYFFNIFIFTKLVLFFVHDSLVMNYFGTNSCWYNFGISVFTGSVTQLPGSLLRPLTCTLLKPGITYAVIEVIIAAMIVAGIIVLYFINKYFSPNSEIKNNVLNFGQMRGIIGTQHVIKREQEDKKNSVHVVCVGTDMLPEVFRIAGSSQFCWIDIYGGNIYGGNKYGPIFWEEKSEESGDESDIVTRTEMELRS